MAEQDIMRVVLPGGGSCRVLVQGESGPRQIRALIRMLEITAEIVEEQPAPPSTSTTTGTEGRDHG